MPEPTMLLIGRMALTAMFLYLLWSLTHHWNVWFWALVFLILPPQLQTLLLACGVLVAVKTDRESRAAKTFTFGPKPITGPVDPREKR